MRLFDLPSGRKLERKKTKNIEYDPFIDWTCNDIILEISINKCLSSKARQTHNLMLQPLTSNFFPQYVSHTNELDFKPHHPHPPLFIYFFLYAMNQI